MTGFLSHCLYALVLLKENIHTHCRGMSDILILHLKSPTLFVGLVANISRDESSLHNHMLGTHNVVRRPFLKRSLHDYLAVENFI